MNELTLQALKHFVSDGNLDHVILVPSLSMGDQLLDAYAVENFGVIGLRAMTPAAYAQEICAAAGKTVPLLSDNAAATLIFSILEKGCSDNGFLVYFKALGASTLTLSTARVVLREVYLLEEFGISELPAAMRQNSRLQDLQTILDRFQEEKQSVGVWDRCDLFAAAQQIVEEHPPRLKAAACTNLTARGVTAQFIRALQPQPIPVPLWEEMSQLSADKFFLPQTAAALPCTPALLRGFGVENETLFPFYDTLKNKYAFGDVAILCADASAFSLLRDHAQQLDIPLTVESGFHLSDAPALQLLRKLAEWKEQDYPAEGFAELVKDGFTPPHSPSLLKFLRKENVGFQKDRYLEHLKAAAASDSEYQHPDYIPQWQEIFKALFSLFDDATAPKDGFAALRALLQEYYIKKDAASRAGQCATIYGLGEQLLSQQAAPLFKNFSGFLSVLLELSETTPWLYARPADGAIHAAPLSRGAFLNRKHTYILGLKQDALTAKGAESPLLRNEERAVLGIPASTADEMLPQLQLGHCLAACSKDDTLVLSYPSYDLSRGLDYDPSVWFKLLAKKTDAGVALFDFFRETGFTAADEWLHSGSLPQQADCKADEKPDLKDFFKNHVFSASALETALACPMQFYIRYVLGVTPPERPELLDTLWLPATGKGNLVHQSLEQYFNAVIAGNPPQDRDEIFNKCLAQFEFDFPCTKVSLKEADTAVTRGMYHACIDAYDPAESEALACEFKLSCKGGGTCSLDGKTFEIPEVFPLKVCRKTILFTGSIDRLDRLPNGHYRIIDYKTSNPVYFTQNMDHKLQYYLYAKAVEQLLGTPVDEAVYLLLDQYSVTPVTVEKPSKQKDCEARLSKLFKNLQDADAITMKKPVWDGTVFSCPDDDPKRQRTLNTCEKFCSFYEICEKEVL